MQEGQKNELGKSRNLHKSHLEIAQLGFRNEFDCPVQTSATILSQQVESNQNWKEAMKIISACSKLPPHHQLHHALQKFWRKNPNVKDLKVLQPFPSSSSEHSLYPQQEFNKKGIFDINGNAQCALHMLCKSYSTADWIEF